MRKQRTPGAERLLKARRAAAKELKLPITDWRVKRYALLTCAYDDVQARLASGANIDIDKLTKLDAAMAEIRASVPREPLKVKVEFVEGPIEHCPKCGWHRDQPLAPPPAIDGEVLPPDTKPIIKSLPSPVAKPETPPAPAHIGGIHDQPGVPLKRYDEPWRAYRRTY